MRLKVYLQFFIFIVFASLVALVPTLVSASFDKDLYFGILNNSDVSSLQDFLFTRGLYVGSTTGNYLSFTKQAVQSFQVQEGIIPVSGYFGSETRAVANGLLEADSQSGISNTLDTSDASSTIPNQVSPQTSDNISNTDNTPHDYSVDIANLASTTDMLSQEFMDLTAKISDLQSQIDILNQTVSSLSTQLSGVQPNVEAPDVEPQQATFDVPTTAVPPTPSPTTISTTPATTSISSVATTTVISNAPTVIPVTTPTPVKIIITPTPVVVPTVVPKPTVVPTPVTPTKTNPTPPTVTPVTPTKTTTKTNR